MRVRKSIIAVIALLAVLMAVPTAAWAQEESGSKSCTGGFEVTVRSESSGITRHYAPTGVWRHTWDNGMAMINRYTDTGDASTSWKVTTTGLLDYNDTYAYCTGP
jgi:hypothetical protein